MPGAHAKLSPSSAERWMECPASIRMSSQVPREQGSSYAEEGTLAHELAEAKVSLAFDLIDADEYQRREKSFMRGLGKFLDRTGKSSDEEFNEHLAEMDRHTDAYVELIRTRAELHPMTQVMVEQRMSCGVPQSWGTSDTVLVSPTHVEIVDFKYGAGVAVEAQDNPQLKLYACGALDTYGDILGDTEVVYTTVHQPRMDHVLTAEMTPEALRTWRTDKVVPVAEVALGPDAPFGPSDTACRWCPASGRCEAQVGAAFPDDLTEGFDGNTGKLDAELLSPERIADLYNRLPFLESWMKALRETALTMAYTEGVDLPGLKVVRSYGSRKLTDEPGAVAALKAEGLTPDQYTKTAMRGIGELEKLLGKDRFAELLGGFYVKPPGKESLVPESDTRESITPNTEAAKVFDNNEE